MAAHDWHDARRGDRLPGFTLPEASRGGVEVPWREEKQRPRAQLFVLTARAKREAARCRRFPGSHQRPCDWPLILG